jgi:hypothetical protein
MSETHLNRLCMTCANHCKQSETARIVECPNFIKKPTEREFRRMVDDLDSAEEAARTIRSRARELIRTALDSSGETGVEEKTDSSTTDGAREEPQADSGHDSLIDDSAEKPSQ